MNQARLVGRLDGSGPHRREHWQSRRAPGRLSGVGGGRDTSLPVQTFPGLGNSLPAAQLSLFSRQGTSFNLARIGVARSKTI